MVIKGIYATKTALEDAKLETAKTGETYMVGKQSPYTLYTFDGTGFKKGGMIGEDTADLKDIPVENVYSMSFTGADGKKLKIRKGLRIGEIEFYRPTEDF